MAGGARIQLGVALPHFDFSIPGVPATWEAIADQARRAEAAGLDSIWVADHLFLEVDKYGGPPGRHGAFDPLVTLAALAATTDRVQLGSLVFCTQLRPPALLAKGLAAVANLAPGRLIAGMGAGWYEPEFAAADVAFEAPGMRLAQLDEAIGVIRAVHTGEESTIVGDHYRLVAAQILPAVDPPLPIWVGGRGDRLLDLVARRADGWNTAWAMTPETYRPRAAVLDAACARHGRDPQSVTRSLALTTLIGEGETDLTRRFEAYRAQTPTGDAARQSLAEWRVGRLVGTPAQVAEQLSGWEAEGIAHVVAGLGALPFSVVGDDAVELLGAARQLLGREGLR